MSNTQSQPMANPPPQYIASSHMPSAFNVAGQVLPYGYEPPYYPVYKQRLQSTVMRCPSEKQIDDQPWKFLGYRALAKWAGSSPDALIVRRFNTAHARVLLFMQDEIAQIEADLEELDKKNMWSPHLVHNGTFREEHEEKRTNLLGLLATKLKAYDDFLLSHRQLRAEPQASTRSVKNLRAWFHNAGILESGQTNNGAIAYDETKFVDTAGDLVSLVPIAKPPLRRFLDRYAAWHRLILCCWPFREDPTEDHHYQTLVQSETTRYHNDAYIDALMTMIITAVGLAALVGPMWILKKQTSESTRLWTISGFLGGFTVFISIVTVAKPFETLAATAAYAAVLMVFMQLGAGGGNNVG